MIFFKILKLDLVYDPEILPLGIELKNIKTLFHEDLHTPMFIVALFSIAKAWILSKCSKCLKADE